MGIKTPSKLDFMRTLMAGGFNVFHTDVSMFFIQCLLSLSLGYIEDEEKKLAGARRSKAKDELEAQNYSIEDKRYE